jgi:hypothetical protein
MNDLTAVSREEEVKPGEMAPGDEQAGAAPEISSPPHLEVPGLAVAAQPETVEQLPEDASVDAPPAAAPGGETGRESARPRFITLPAALLMTCSGSLLSFFLAVFFVLGLLGIINQGWQYSRPQQVYGLGSQVAELENLTQAQQTALGGYQTRLSAVEGLAARMADTEKDLLAANVRLAEVEKELAGLESSLEEQAAEVSTWSAKIDQAELNIDALATRTQRFQAFLTGLSELIAGLGQIEKP